MDLGLKNKVIAVSGGARGIGAAICEVLCEEGAIPVILDIKDIEGEKLSAILKTKGYEASFLRVDLRNGKAIQKAVAEIIDVYDHLDGLINNAGINDGIGLESGDLDEFKLSLEKNLYHYYDLTHGCLPHLKQSKGSIVNIASKVAVTGQGGTSGYAAAKGAQLALTREWAVELLKYGIRVNAILPAEVKTPLYEEWIKSFEDPEEKLADIERLIPLENRMTTPVEIASMAVFLLSEKASHITGQHIFIDGGYTHLDRGLNT